MLHYKTKRLQYEKYSFNFDDKNDGTLATLRYGKFMQAVATYVVAEPETLPRTVRVMYFHSLRVHPQVSLCKYFHLQCFKPEECRVDGKDSMTSNQLQYQD